MLKQIFRSIGLDAKKEHLKQISWSESCFQLLVKLAESRMTSIFLRLNEQGPVQRSATVDEVSN